MMPHASFFKLSVAFEHPLKGKNHPKSLVNPP